MDMLAVFKKDPLKYGAFIKHGEYSFCSKCGKSNSLMKGHKVFICVFCKDYEPVNFSLYRMFNKQYRQKYINGIKLYLARKQQTKLARKLHKERNKLILKRAEEYWKNKPSIEMCIFNNFISGDQK